MTADTDRSKRSKSSPVVIVGGGAAGIHAALACRHHYPDKPVTLVDAEAEIGYYRPLIPQYILGKIDAPGLFFWQENQDPLDANARACLAGGAKIILLEAAELVSDDPGTAAEVEAVVAEAVVHPSAGEGPGS